MSNYLINYRETRRGELNERSKEKIWCKNCNCYYVKCHKSRHMKSNKHKSKLN